MSRRSLQLDDAVYDYLLSKSLRESALLKKLRAQTAKHPLANMQISPEQGQFFAFLIKALNVKKAIEIGVFTGYSSLVIAEALPPDGTLIACDVDIETTKIAAQYWQLANLADKIELRIGAAIETLDELLCANQAGCFDFAFIDAHKPEYIDYYERLLKLMRPGGVIAVDNVLWSGEVANTTKQDHDTNAIRRFNDHISQDKRVFISMIPIADGLTLAIKQ